VPRASAASPLDTGNLTLEDIRQLRKWRPDLKSKLDRIEAAMTERMAIESQLERASLRDDPVLFARNVLGLKPTPTASGYGYKHGISPQQIRVLESIRDHKLTAVPAGHGLGKTFIMAVVVLWWMSTREDAFVLTTAPTWTLVEEQLWREIGRLHGSAKVPLPGKVMKTKWDLGRKWFAIGISTNEAARFRGFHSAWNLVIFDEATGIDREFYPEARSFLLNAHDRMALIGNPTDPSTAFKEACDNPLWNVITLDGRQHPNVVHNNPNIIPGAVTKEWIEEQKVEYGGEDSPFFGSRVAGLWPTKAENALIEPSTILRAQKWDERRAALEKVPSHLERFRGEALGLDIAGPGSDLATLWHIVDGRARLLGHKQATAEIMDLVHWVVREIRSRDGRVHALALDDTGIGNGVGSRLNEMRKHARSNLSLSGADVLGACSIIRCNFGESARYNPQKFSNLKSEMWWMLRESFRLGTIGLPTDKEMLSYQLPKGNNITGQLSTAIYTVQPDGRIHVWDKRSPNEKAKHLPDKSPDLAHGLILANFAYSALRPELLAPQARTLEEQVKARRAQTIHMVEKQAENENEWRFEPFLDEDDPFSMLNNF
jgi:hypothetical protein